MGKRYRLTVPNSARQVCPLTAPRRFLATVTDASQA
jgi:hypothetical protein